RELGFDAGVDEVLEDLGAWATITEIFREAGCHRRPNAGHLLEPLRVLPCGFGQEPRRSSEPAVATSIRLVLAGRNLLDQPGCQVDRRRPAHLRNPESGKDPLVGTLTGPLD